MLNKENKINFYLIVSVKEQQFSKTIENVNYGISNWKIVCIAFITLYCCSSLKKNISNGVYTASLTNFKHFCGF